MIFDVGANEGNYSRRIFDKNANATIFAFEPHPKNFQKLVVNIKNPNFHPINCAVGCKGGVLSLYDYEKNDGSTHASLYKEVIETLHKSKSVERKVEVIALGAFMKSNAINSIDLLKIDTEGNELDVLKGVLAHLSDGSVKAIHFEFNEMNVLSRTYFKDFWDMLPNYVFYRMLPNELVKINSYNPLLCEIFAYQNIVAILKDKSKL